MKNIFAVIILSTILLFGGCQRNFDKPNTEKLEEIPVIIEEPKTEHIHIVLEGEDVAIVAKKYGMTRSVLIEMNGLKPPYRLFAGQKLFIIPKITNNNTDIIESNTTESNSYSSEHGGSCNLLDSNQSIRFSPQISAGNYTAPVLNFASRIKQQYTNDSPDIVIGCKLGEDVYAVADGEIMVAGFLDDKMASYGKAIIIKHHALNRLSAYFRVDNICVQVGDKVQKGQVIASAGQTGYGAKYPQLQYRIYTIEANNTKAINPIKVLPINA